MYVLYGGRFTRALLVEMVMAEGGLPYELREVDIVKHEHREPGYLAVNPAGWVPALLTPEGETLYETPAINLYLAERHGLTRLAPRVDEADRGLFLSGFFYVGGELEPALKRHFYPHRYVFRQQDEARMKERALEDALARIRVMEQRLDRAGPYHLGTRFSLVDLTMSYWAAILEPLGALEACPALRRCMHLVMERPRLRPRFDSLAEWRDDYARMQARGEGVK